MAVAIQQPTVRVSLFWLWLAGGLFVASAAASQGDDQNHGVVFIYPTAGQIYHVNDTINVTYTSPFPTPNLYGFCDGGGRQVFMRRAMSFNATMPIVLNFTSATPCYFDLRPDTLPGHGANSPSFSIIGQESSSGPTVFGPSSTPTVTAALSTSTGPRRGTETTEPTAPVSLTSSTSVASSNPSSVAGVGGAWLSTAAAAGIGVGVAAGLLGVAAVVCAWYWRRGKHGVGEDGKDHPAAGPAGSDYQRYQQPTGWQNGEPKELGAQHQFQQLQEGKTFLAELSTSNTPAEIASSQIQEIQHELPVYM